MFGYAALNSYYLNGHLLTILDPFVTQNTDTFGIPNGAKSGYPDNSLNPQVMQENNYDPPTLPYNTAFMDNDMKAESVFPSISNSIMPQQMMAPPPVQKQSSTFSQVKV